MTNQKSLHEQIAEKLIEALQAGTSPFQKPWTDDYSAGFVMPLNPTTGKSYRGINALWLAMQNRKDPRWMTLKQASFNKWAVEKGAKATMINFVKTSEIRPVLDGEGNKVIEDGKTKTEFVKLDKPIITTAWVFNAEQIKGIPEWKHAYGEQLAAQQWTPIERAENIIANSQASIRHGGNDAFYNLGKDCIQLPKKEQFASAARYYATLLHELGHWTGHKERLDRPMGGKFGSKEYAREELRAEISSLMVGSEINIGHDFGQHAAYVESWISILRDDPMELYRASADAQKILDYVLNLEEKRELTTEKGTVQNHRLEKGDLIAHKETQYQVLAELKNKVFQMQDTGDGRKFKMSSKDGLHNSLLEAKYDNIDLRQNSSQEQQQDNSIAAESEMNVATGFSHRL